MGLLTRREPPPRLPAYGWRGATVLTLACAVIGGCTWLGDIRKGELSTYAEPGDGATARVRLLGARPKVYPDSACVGVNVPGSGYPAGWKVWGLAPRTLGMPQPAGRPEDAIEVRARAGEPVTISFQYAQSSYTPGPAGTGAPGTHRSAHCTVARTFVPEAGVDYEVRGLWSGNRACSATVTELRMTRPHGVLLRIPVDSAPAFGCAGESRRAPHVPAAPL